MVRMIKKILFIAFFTLCSCTDQKEATRVLNQQGYKNIKFNGYDPFGCSKDDFYHTKFTAISPNGQKVKGTVCSSPLFKKSTVRW